MKKIYLFKNSKLKIQVEILTARVDPQAFFTILSSDFEIHIQMPVSLGLIVQTKYSVFKKDEILEVGEDSLFGAVNRIIEIIKENR